MKFSKNEIYTAEILDYTTEGNGICKIDGFAIFVPHACVGDVAEIRILKCEKNYAYGKIEKLLSLSPDRITPECPAAQCGGCTFQHIRYEAELRFKQKRVTDALTRIGKLDPALIKSIVPCRSPGHYRNKAQFPLAMDKDGTIRAGFYAAHTHRVVPVKQCFLQADCFAKATEIFLDWANANHLSVYDEKKHSGLLRHLYLRYAAKTGQLMVCVVINGSILPKEQQLVEQLQAGLEIPLTVVVNINREKTNVITGKQCRTVYGEGYITDELCGLQYRISPLSFYQVNRDQAERLYEIAAELAAPQPHEYLLDLYCGTGTIGLSMAAKVKKLMGVEIIPQAIEDAIRNARQNGISNAEFICGDAGQAAALLRQRGETPDCIILDPPRKGCSLELIRQASAMQPSRLVYVSCDPATLARDVALFAEFGYYAKVAVPVDMFPRTAHVETVVLMSRVEGK